jgi:hypothetical protein
MEIIVNHIVGGIIASICVYIGFIRGFNYARKNVTQTINIIVKNEQKEEGEINAYV